MTNDENPTTTIPTETPELPGSARKRTLTLAAAILLVGSIVLASLWALNQINQAAAIRRQTHDVLAGADGLLATLRDAETGERGYALTGDETYLQPYLAARDRVGPELAELRRRAANSPGQRHLDALTPLVSAKMADVSMVIELRRNNNSAAVLAAVKSGTGKRLMDQVRLEIAGFTDGVQAARDGAERTFQSMMGTLFALISLASVLGFLLALGFANLMSRDGKHRARALVHLETRRLLGVQEEMNLRLELANQALRDGEEKLAVTLNSIGDGVIATDADGRVTLLNPVAEQLTGWTQAEAQGLAVADTFHIVNKASRDLAAIPVGATLAQGTVQGLANHTVLISRKGQECDIADSCAPIRDHQGQVVGAVLVFRDVTEEYATQQALRDSTALVGAILNTVSDGLITIEASGGIIDTINPAAERMFGYTPAELIGKRASLLIPELDSDRGDGSLEPYQASAEAQAQNRGRELSGRRKDGSRFPLEIGANEMWLGGKRYFTGILRDITARKQAEEALLEAGALQRAIFSSANFSSIATDAAGVIQIFNVGAERMLGYTAAEVVNKKSPADLSDPHELVARARVLSGEFETALTPGFEALVFKAARGIEDIYELTYIRKDGGRIPAMVSVTALRDPHDDIIGYLLIGTDNTARLQVEVERQKLDQRLRDQQFYNRSLIESNIDALMTTDPQGIISDVNQQMVVLTGCTRDELIGAPFKSCFTDPNRAEAAIKLVLRDKRVTDYELTAQSRDGRHTVVSCNAATFYDRGRNLQGVFAAARDITERKHLDQILQEQNVELLSARLVAERANLAKSDFLSSMSHELRTPLNAILGFAQLIESGSPAPTISQKRGIDQIQKGGWYLLELINEILDLALIESGRASLSLEPISLDDVLRDCQAMIEPQAQKRGLAVTFARIETPRFVMADRTRLKQVLINLLSNAVKYNKAKGTVRLECLETGAGRIRIWVKDEGNGLSPEDIDQLFQPFNRLGQEAGVEEGTGIGLVVAKRLIELMGGAIGVISHASLGSHFWVDLDLTTAPQAESGALDFARLVPTQPQGDARRHTILYVEDNPANLMLVEDLLARRPNIRMLSARDGLRGIEVARASRPDVILMDINLPGISGTKAMQILATDPLTAHIPVIAISANAIPRDIQKGLEAGFFRYLTKPLRVHEFMGTLDLALSLAKAPAGRTVRIEELDGR